jgi:hypothetical protein
MKCPICKSKANLWKVFKSNVIEGSGLYKDIVVYRCPSCIHFFNKIKRKDKDALFNMLIPLFKERIKMSKHSIELSHVLEHMNLKLAFKPLRQWNVIEIKCPNACRYVEQKSINQIYCWLIKTHIHHFTPESLYKLFDGFYPQSFSEYDNMELNGKLNIPSMHVVFTRFNPHGFFYYGAGREFLHQFETIKCDGILDDKEYGRSVNGVKIYHSEICKHLSERSTIKITSWFHYEEMKQKLLDMGYKGRIL